MPQKVVRGRFIVFEGGEGCGKSTQAELLAGALGAVLTREPGGTALGIALRAVLLDPTTTGLDDRAEALLMVADRAQHVAEVVRPALDAGRHVVSDRFAGSSIAYQAYGRGLDEAWVRALSEGATGGLRPDLVVLLDVPSVVAARRLSGQLDRFEQAGDAFHTRVAAGFAVQATADPAHWVVIDGTASVDEVAAAVRARARDRLQLDL